MCHKSFIPTKELKNFCSVKCRDEFRKEYKRIHGNERYKLKVIDNHELRECQICGSSFHPKHGNQKYCNSRCSFKANLIQQDASARKLDYKNRKELRIAMWTTCPECGGKLYLFSKELLWKCGNSDCNFQKKDKYKHTRYNLKIFDKVL